jgi:adenylate cyclase
VVGNLSQTILEQTKDLAELKIDNFFGVASGINTGTAVRLENGLLVWQDWDAFRRFLLPMMQRLPQVSAVGAGDSEGNAYNLVRFGTHWRSQEIRPAEWGAETLWKEWSGEGKLLREWREESGFDPRQRPWFIGALTTTKPDRQTAHESGGGGGSSPAAVVPDPHSMTEVLPEQNAVSPPKPFWTPPYKFFTTGDYGLTVSTRVPWTNRVDAVVYFDVRLRDLDDFLFENKPSPNGFILLLNEDLEVIGWPGREAFAREKLLTGQGGVEVAVENLPHLAEALQLWRARGEPDELADFVQHGEEHFWLNFRSLPNLGTIFRVLIAVPEDDVLGEVYQERQRMALVFVVGLCSAIGLAFWLAALYARPISELAERSEAIQRLDLSARTEILSRVAEVQKLSMAQATMTSALESFSRYVPREVIAELLRQGEAAKISAHPAELTVLFTDIRRFTAISETLLPDDIARYLSDYFDALHGIIEAHHGTTDKFIGDAIMAFWGAPRPDEQHASNAVRAVLACSARLAELNRQWKAAGRPEFLTSFGLASGPVVVGNVGAARRLNYTVLGNTVNVASRCVGLGRELGCSILALESVAQATRGDIEWRRLGPVRVRGIRRPMMVCEPLGVMGQVEGDRLALKRDYECALDAYLAKDFDEALRLLARLGEARTGELSVQFLIRRCHELQRQSSTEFHTDMLSFS